MKLGVDLAELVEGVSLFLDAPWSSQAVKQAHPSASRLLRCHRTMSAKLAQARTTLVHISALMTGSVESTKIAAIDKRIAAIDKRIARLHKKQPQRISGRHMLFSDLQRLAKVHRDDGRDGYDRAVGKRLVARCAARWREMPAERRHAFFARAEDLRADRQREIAGAIEGLQAQAEVWRLQIEDLRSTGPPCRFVLVPLRPRTEAPLRLSLFEETAVDRGLRQCAPRAGP